MKLRFSLFSMSLNHSITDVVFFHKLILVVIMIFRFIRSRIALLILPTVFTRISAAALIQFFAPQVRRLFEGGAYSRAVLI